MPRASKLLGLFRRLPGGCDTHSKIPKECDVLLGAAQHLSHTAESLAVFRKTWLEVSIQALRSRVV